MDRRILIRMLALAPALLFVPTPARGQCEPAEPVKLSAPDPHPLQSFGRAVAIFADLLAIGAPGDGEKGNGAGAVYLYARQAGTWTLQQKLLAPDGNEFDSFGRGLDLKGQLLVVGAPGVNDLAGAVYIFRHAEGVWKQEKKFLGNAGPFSRFGESVAIGEDTLDALVAVGEPKGPGDIGAAYLYRGAEGGVWGLEATLTALDGSVGDRFGTSVDVEGGVATVGAYRDAPKGIVSGSVYVFRQTKSEWAQEQKITATDGFAWQGFGVSLSLSLPLLLVGTSAYDENFEEQLLGAAYVFLDAGAGWEEEAKIESPLGVKDDAFGWSVDLRGGLALMGAPDGGEGYGGAAYTFARRSPGEWKSLQTFDPQDPASESFGWRVALSDDTALLGDFLSAGAAGAAYFAELCPLGCYADIDGDGSLTIFDFLAFLNAFNSADGVADCDQSGEFDLFDFFCFLNAFAGGCG